MQLRTLTAGVSRSDTREVLQSATFGLGYGTRFGQISLSDADAVYELIPTVSDPLVVSAFQSVYSWSLVLAARYDDALRVSDEFLATAQRHRLDFAVPYALSSAAAGSAGLRKWKQARDFGSRAFDLTRGSRDLAGQQHAFSVLLRILAQQRRHRAALAIGVPSVRSPLPAAHAEVVMSRAFVLASVGRVEEARRFADEVRNSTRAALPAVLGAAVMAISSVKQGESDVIERTRELEETAFATGAVDLLVTAYRSTPELLPIMLRASAEPERLGQLLRDARDEDLAVVAGHARSDDDPRARLSSRERDVHGLLGQGLTNFQIAELLFISETTVKVHVHHIYDKLGVRSRTALIVQAALERSDQATSAIEGEDSVGS